MLLLKVPNSAVQNDAIFMNIVFPFFACILVYFYLKRKPKDLEAKSDLGIYTIRSRAKIGAYIFGVLFFIAFLIGVYKGIKFWLN
jgi:hypothetical protein